MSPLALLLLIFQYFYSMQMNHYLDRYWDVKLDLSDVVDTVLGTVRAFQRLDDVPAVARVDQS